MAAHHVRMRVAILVALLAVCAACGGGADVPTGGDGSGSVVASSGSGGLDLPAAVDVLRLDAEGDTTCAHLADGATCWTGSGSPQALGSVAADTPPVQLGGWTGAPPALELSTADAGGGDVCIVSSEGGAWCLVSGSTGKGCPGPLSGAWSLCPGATQVSVSASAVCYVEASGGLVCNGAAVASNVAAVSAGGLLRCHLDVDGAVTCGDTVALPGPADDVAAGGNHACAVVAGEAWCWGAGADGQCGGTLDNAAEPRRIELPHPVEVVAAGERHSCAYTSAGHVWCWGDGDPQPWFVQL